MNPNNNQNAACVCPETIESRATASVREIVKHEVKEIFEEFEKTIIGGILPCTCLSGITLGVRADKALAEEILGELLEKNGTAIALCPPEGSGAVTRLAFAFGTSPQPDCRRKWDTDPVEEAAEEAAEIRAEILRRLAAAENPFVVKALVALFIAVDNADIAPSCALPSPTDEFVRISDTIEEACRDGFAVESFTVMTLTYLNEEAFRTYLTHVWPVVVADRAGKDGVARLRFEELSTEGIVGDRNCFKVRFVNERFENDAAALVR